ncbi:MAG: ATP-binding protein [Ruminococcaceae bacterium]|nr:ATP-binding protein [Oscillospiraceae bacterium]
MESAYERINGYVLRYNQAREAGNLPIAVEMARCAVKDAEEELAKPEGFENAKSYYREILPRLKQFLANPTAAKPTAKGVGLAARQSEDKIKTTDWFGAPIPDLTLSDIAGLRDVKDEFIVNVMAPTHPDYADIYRKYRGDERCVQVMMYGPPGTGKTHAVKCLAGQLKCKIAVVQIKDVMASLVGEGAKIIYEIFDQASKLDRCIIFFDEIDAIASTREGDDSRHTKEQLTTLLTCMDGFASKAKPGQVRIIIAATNRPWALDSAVKRGGRFDTQIYIPLPDDEARLQLIRLALGKDPKVKNRCDIPMAEDVTLEWRVERTRGYAGADIKAICRQAASLPLKREIIARGNKQPLNDCITKADFETVFSRYINSNTVESLMMFDAYKNNMAYDQDYIRFKLDYLLRAVYSNSEYRKGNPNVKEEIHIEWYEEEWFWSYFDDGMVQKLFKTKWRLDFLMEERDLWMKREKSGQEEIG